MAGGEPVGPRRGREWGEPVAQEKKGTPTGALDLMIGTHALALGATLATKNTREFSRVRGLTVVDWLEDEVV